MAENTKPEVKQDKIEILMNALAKQPKKTLGRPSVFTPEILQKLDEAFLMGCTDPEACLYADIAPSSLYNYQKANPDYLERKEALKSNPFMLARRNIAASLGLGSIDSAQWLLEKYDKNAVSPTVQNNTQVNVFSDIKEKLTITKTEEVIEPNEKERPDGTDNSGLQDGDRDILPSGGQERTGGPVQAEHSPEQTK